MSPEPGAAPFARSGQRSDPGYLGTPVDPACSPVPHSATSLSAPARSEVRDPRSRLVWLTWSAAAISITIGGWWLAAWWSGTADQLGASGMLTVKTNMAVAQILCGFGIVLLSVQKPAQWTRIVGLSMALCVGLIGILTFSEHVLQIDLRIDQFFTQETPGAPGTTNPNRMGPPGSLCLALAGAGLFALNWKRPWTSVFGVLICAITLIPLLGYLYSVEEFYSRARVTGIAWPTVLVLFSVGMALTFAPGSSAVADVLLSRDAGGQLFRHWLPLVILVPLLLGFFRVRGQHLGLYDTAAGTASLILVLILGFTTLLWFSANRLARADRARATLLQDFRALADSVPNLAWWANSDGSVLWYNRRFYEYTGTNPGQIEGLGWQAVHDPEILPSVMDKWHACVASRQPFEMEFPLRGADGSFRWFLTRIVPVGDASGQGTRWFGTATDITELREARLVLARSKDDLERLVADRTARLRDLVGELEHFSYSITHDMRAPLRAMRGYGELVRDMVTESTHPDMKGFVDKIVVSAERMDALIRDALSYSRSVRQELPLEAVDPGRLLRGMLDSYPEFQVSRAHIVVQGELPLVVANQAGLTQCFSNLLGNAVKFVKPGRLPDIRVWAEERGPWVRIWVEDQGIGISHAMLPRLFEMFTRGTHSYEGTGIGLALVRKVAQRMGGRVGVEAIEGQGSRFWLELPPVPGTHSA